MPKIIDEHGLIEEYQDHELWDTANATTHTGEYWMLRIARRGAIFPATISARLLEAKADLQVSAQYDIEDFYPQDQVEATVKYYSELLDQVAAYRIAKLKEAKK